MPIILENELSLWAHGINVVTDSFNVEDFELEVYTVRTMSSVRLKAEQTVTLKTRPVLY